MSIDQWIQCPALKQLAIDKRVQRSTKPVRQHKLPARDMRQTHAAHMDSAGFAFQELR